jgi:hypothetical protein
MSKSNVEVAYTRNAIHECCAMHRRISCSGRITCVLLACTPAQLGTAPGRTDGTVLQRFPSWRKRRVGPTPVVRAEQVAHRATDDETECLCAGPSRRVRQTQALGRKKPPREACWPCCAARPLSCLSYFDGVYRSGGRDTRDEIRLTIC